MSFSGEQSSRYRASRAHWRVCICLSCNPSTETTPFRSGPRLRAPCHTLNFACAGRQNCLHEAAGFLPADSNLSLRQLKHSAILLQTYQLHNALAYADQVSLLVDSSHIQFVLHCAPPLQIEESKYLKAWQCAGAPC